MALRTKSGRLTKKYRERKIQEGEEGTVVIFDPQKRRRKSGRGLETSRDSWHADFAMLSEFAFDLDCRKLVEFISINLASHYEASLLAGVKADGSGPLPGVMESTVRIAQEQGQPHKHWGVRSGWMARNWWLGKITGGTYNARRLIKPNGANGRGTQINRWLNPKDPGTTIVDLQSVAGAAGQIIAQSFQTYADGMGGRRVNTPRTATTNQGVLPQLRR